MYVSFGARHSATPVSHLHTPCHRHIRTTNPTPCRQADRHTRARAHVRTHGRTRQVSRLVAQGIAIGSAAVAVEDCAAAAAAIVGRLANEIMAASVGGLLPVLVSTRIRGLPAVCRSRLGFEGCRQYAAVVICSPGIVDSEIR